MKPILYIALAGSLALGACSSTYKTAQTPDDVYYSPRQQQRAYASNNGSNGNSAQDENARYTDSPDEDGGTYVTYDDDQGDYQRRINRFGSNANTYNGGYWDGYNAASNMYMGGFGYGYGPYSSFGYSSLWGPSFSMGFGYGGFYRPWSYGLGMGWGWGGYPYVGSYWPYYGGGYYGHYYPYYAGGYYGGGHYGGGYYTRPSNSYGPVRGVNERLVRSANSYNGNSGGGNAGGNNYYRPARGASAPVNGGGNGNYVPGNTDRPRRVFQQSSSERPVISRPSAPSYNNGGYNNSNNGGYSRPNRTEYSRPSSPAPSYSPPSGGGSRVGGGGGGSTGGGGYSRPSRGGR
ncbi:hypothetical protein [Chitinophaga qingshengii]|uniref:Prolyl-tRNA synthetase n=1 Tax=Chitinophaga qingshengii TaxID=1569794 RepID=A0ABR7THL7_9BACT|nr:hypothetical protein [Chitinophaga qingshengii]MBC9929993.1 hypothetical protein [Chitinophaga qingshengii]